MASKRWRLGRYQAASGHFMAVRRLAVGFLGSYGAICEVGCQLEEAFLLKILRDLVNQQILKTEEASEELEQRLEAGAKA